MIAEGLRSLTVPIDSLAPLAGNPRKGDIEAVKRSYEQFGQRKPIVARRDTREVIAGNHQLAAAKALGWTEIAVVFVDDDDQKAKAFALADNRTHDLGTYDDVALDAMLSEIRTPELQFAAGFTVEAIEELSARVKLADARASVASEKERNAHSGSMVVQYNLIFDSEEQQQRWYAVVRALKKKYPQVDTIAARLDLLFSELEQEGRLA